MSEFQWVAFAAVAIVSSARLTRLATWDRFPPVEWARNKYVELTDKSDRTRAWQLLAFCAYCASFWLTALVVGWAYLAGVDDGETAWGSSGELAQPLWWTVNGTLAASYLAAILMVLDGDNGDEN